MKDQYFGDINDFRKYCILSRLSQGTGLPICFVWMRTLRDGRPDGRKTRYLRNVGPWPRLNPPLFDFLRRHVLGLKERKVAAFREAPGFSKARFIEDILTGSPAEQGDYFAKVRRVARPNDILFFDPDNGMEVKSVKEGRTKSAKHLYWRDLIPLYEAGHSVIIYQHFPREKRVPYIKRRIRELESRLDGSRAFAIRTSHVLFLIAPRLRDIQKVESALKRAFVRDGCPHWENVFEFRDRFLSS